LFLQATIFLNILAYVAVHVTVNSKDDAERNRTLLALEHITLLACVAAIVVCLPLLGLLQNFLQFDSVWPFVALLAAMLISVPLNMRMAFLRGRKQYLRSSLTDGIGSASKLVLSLGLVVAGLGSAGAAMGLALSQVISLGCGLWWGMQAGLTGIGLRRSNLNLAVLRPQLRYAGAVFFATIGVTVVMSLDILAVKHYFPPEQAGLYAGMATVGRIIFFLTAPFTAVLLTMVNLRAPDAKNMLWLKGTLGLTLAIGGTAVLTLALGGDFIIKLLVGSKYLVYANLLPQLCVAMLLLGLANTLLMYQVALRRFIFSALPVAVTIFTLILVYVRHNEIAQVINDILIGSSVLMLSVATATWIYEKARKK
jgi:O-antigen/teichoic acid export membrane protein